MDCGTWNEARDFQCNTRMHQLALTKRTRAVGEAAGLQNEPGVAVPAGRKACGRELTKRTQFCGFHKVFNGLRRDQKDCKTNPARPRRPAGETCRTELTKRTQFCTFHRIFNGLRGDDSSCAIVVDKAVNRISDLSRAGRRDLKGKAPERTLLLV